jgi:hypothetical protein
MNSSFESGENYFFCRRAMATITGITQGIIPAPMQKKPYVGGMFPLVEAPDIFTPKLPSPRKTGMLNPQQHNEKMAATITASIIGIGFFFAGVAGVGSIDSLLVICNPLVLHEFPWDEIRSFSHPNYT